LGAHRQVASTTPRPWRAHERTRAHQRSPPTHTHAHPHAHEHTHTHTHTHARTHAHAHARAPLSTRQAQDVCGAGELPQRARQGGAGGQHGLVHRVPAGEGGCVRCALCCAVFVLCRVVLWCVLRAVLCCDVCWRGACCVAVLHTIHGAPGCLMRGSARLAHCHAAHACARARLARVCEHALRLMRPNAAQPGPAGVLDPRRAPQPGRLLRPRHAGVCVCVCVCLCVCVCVCARATEAPCSQLTASSCWLRLRLSGAPCTAHTTPGTHARTHTHTHTHPRCCPTRPRSPTNVRARRRTSSCAPTLATACRRSRACTRPCPGSTSRSRSC
jgi:hypothetical protein